MSPEHLARAMVATVGHELRTPLTSIRGYLETLLDEEWDAPTTRRFLETARRETLRLSRLVEGMLEFSMLELVATEPCGQCNVVEQIEATVEMIAPLAAARRVTIRTYLPESAPARVDGDACVHALANLVENAVKHGADGGTIDVRCDREERYVQIAVEDDGGGIPSAQRESIFLLGASSALPGRGGRGIGLAVVKAIAERAGGDVRVEPSALGGAKFVLRFPAG